MKTMLKLALILALLLLLPAGAARAQASSAAANKIATVDLKKVFDRYYKLDQVRKAFEKEAADIDKDLKNMATDAAKAQDEYKKLRDAEDDTMISSTEKAARKAKADAKEDEIKSYQADLGNYDQQAKEKLALDRQHMMDMLMQDIQTAINAKAKKAGFSLVLDISAQSANSPASVVLYSAGDNDITDEIIKQLNAAAPPASATDSGTNSVKADSILKQ
jgi:outer membrane protein